MAPVDGAIDLLSGKTQNLKAVGMEWIGESYALSERNVSLSSMCNWKDRCEVSRYYLKVTLAAKKFLNGENVLAIQQSLMLV